MAQNFILKMDILSLSGLKLGHQTPAKYECITGQ